MKETGHGLSRHCTATRRSGPVGIWSGERWLHGEKLCSKTSWACPTWVRGDPKVSRWWGSSDLIQERTLARWNKTGGWTERESGFEWEGGRRRLLQPWWSLLENPCKLRGCKEGALRGCIKQREQAWGGSKAVRSSSPGAHCPGAHSPTGGRGGCNVSVLSGVRPWVLL